MDFLYKFDKITNDFFDRYNFNINYEIRNYDYSENINLLDLYINIRLDKRELFEYVLAKYYIELINNFKNIIIKRFISIRGNYHFKIKKQGDLCER